MRTINIHEAKTHLSRLVEQVAAGEPFIIAKAGKPVAKVVPLDAPAKTKIRRLGFMQGQGTVPDDFDDIARDEIEQMFAGES
jgi:prevent-host-death family protein